MPAMRLPWRYKALVQKLFSRAPGGEKLNAFAQKYLTRRLRVTDRDIQATAKHVHALVRILQQRGQDLRDTTAFEFGAGWFLLKQLLLSLYGCKNQFSVDLRPLASIALINQALRQLARVSPSLGTLSRSIRPITSFRDLLTHYGISYFAPFDARACGLAVGSVDLVSSTATLEHIPPGDIRVIARECRRILRADGLAVHYIDYTDHFAHVDRGISIYNFLRFSEDEWSQYNSSIHYQNRLRHVEYVRLFSEEGFEVLEEHCERPGPAELQTLEKLPLSPAFAGYSLDELSVQGSLLVLRPAVTARAGPGHHPAGSIAGTGRRMPRIST
jgi:hypothetical protein